jgi:hypothetical protein
MIHLHHSSTSTTTTISLTTNSTILLISREPVLVAMGLRHMMATTSIMVGTVIISRVMASLHLLIRGTVRAMIRVINLILNLLLIISISISINTNMDMDKDTAMVRVRVRDMEDTGTSFLLSLFVFGGGVCYDAI